MKPKILVVEDDTEISQLISEFLRQHGPFDVFQTETIGEVDNVLSNNHIDLIVLDVMLPDGSGIDKCRELRTRGVTTPIIIATAVTDEIDKVLGLEHGADDYVGKPYSPREMVARIKAVLRRVQGTPEPATGGANFIYTFEGFALDTASRTVVRLDTHMEIEFTSAEFDVLQCFMKMPNQPINRMQIIQMTHNRTTQNTFDRSVDVLVSRIRNQLEKNGARKDLLKTIRNSGYQITANIDKRPARA